MEKLVLLVGSNPLPNYLTAMALKPQRVLLVYSSQTTEPKDRLRDVLRQKGFEVEECCVPATDARSIRERLREEFKTLPPDSHLNYTGGTKTMAAHARMAFAEQGGTDERASYLDERAAVIRFDDGQQQIELAQCDVELTLEIALRLHGATSWVQESEPRLEDACKIAAVVFKKPIVAADLYQLHRKDGRRLSVSIARENKKRLSAMGLNLSVDDVPDDNWNSKAFKDWCKFLDGLWFEQWTTDVVRSLVGNSVSVNVECSRSDRKFELDVVVVRGHRVHVLSCTTDSTVKLCKSKLFEVAMRAAQVGGESARSAVVCLLDGSDDNGDFVTQLRNDVDDVWDSPNSSPRVFGLADLRAWMGTPEVGVAPNTESLRAWLES